MGSDTPPSEPLLSAGIYSPARRCQGFGCSNTKDTDGSESWLAWAGMGLAKPIQLLRRGLGSLRSREAFGKSPGITKPSLAGPDALLLEHRPGNHGTME